MKEIFANLVSSNNKESDDEEINIVDEESQNEENEPIFDEVNI